ncbi:SIS domain-containing protein [bacterium]|nr:MAG: SIS domain-containing protein [bacterium]
MKAKIIHAFEESISVKQQFLRENLDLIIKVSHILSDTFTRGNKVILFGNGGSATDASHIAGEFVNRFKKNRPGLPAIALNTDVAVLTSIANDYDFSEVFSRQMKALAQEGDVAIAISTSGNSPNILKAVDAAKKKKVTLIALTGLKGNKLATKADHSFVVSSRNTPRIQEVHITLGHVLCQMVEEILFESHRNK